MSERVLPAVRSGSDLVPGVPARVTALAEQLDEMARGLAAAERLLHGAGVHGWTGTAARAFALALQSVPQPFGRAARAIGAASTAVGAHAGVLLGAQRDAGEAIALDLRAVALMRTPGPPSAVPAVLQHRALALVEQARARVRATATEAATGLRHAAQAAPDQPTALVRLVHGLIELQRELQLGAVESTLTAVTAVGLYRPGRATTDPQGWWRDVRTLGAGLRELADHPGRSALAIIDWDAFVHNPGRFVGHLAPDLVVGVATGGTALVSNRGVSVGVRAAALVSRGPARHELRTALSTARATSRSRLRTVDLRAYCGPPNDFGYVSTLTPAQHLVTSALARDARWAERDLTRRVLAAAASLDLRRVGAPHTVKGRESLLRKVSQRVAEPTGIQQVLPRINDTVRYTLLADPSSYLTKVGSTVTDLRARGLTLVQAKNFWATDRYRGLNLTFADARTGRLVEVQLHTPESFTATVDTHLDYERFRQQGISSTEQQRLGARIGAVFGAVPAPRGIDRLEAVLSDHPTTAAVNARPQLLSAHPWGVPGATAGAVAVSSLPFEDDGRPPR